MLRRRTTLTAISLLAFSAAAATAQAHPPERDAADVPDPLIFPVVGGAGYEDDFGDPRGQGAHQGNDIRAPRRAPAVAVEDGRVELWTSSARAGCMLYLRGESGTTYLYVHLNNDLGRRNDNGGGCVQGVAYAPGLESGEAVRAGELVGYVGDSGDANGIHPHLHFELHPSGGAAISPYPWLRRARRLLFAVAETPELEAKAAAGGGLRLVLYGTVGMALPGEPPALQLHATRVRLSTGWRASVERGVTVSVPASAVVQRSTGQSRQDARIGEGVFGEHVIVWTGRVVPGLETQLGEPGALEAVQVLFRGERDRR